MNILVTGASGFVGKDLIKKLIINPSFDRITVLLRKYNLDFDSKVVQILGQEDSFFSTEILDNTHVVIHLAGRAHILNDDVANPLEEFRKVNVDGTLKLAQIALESNVKRFIFISSIGVNGSTTSKPFDESDQPNPHADYAISKLEAEVALQALFKNTSTELVIIRPPLIYAANAPGNFSRLLKLVATNLPLPFAQTKNKRTFVALENLIDFIELCIDHPNAANQIFLVADKESLSTRELVEYLKQGMNKKPFFVYIPQPLMRLTAACIGKSKLYEQLFESLEVDTSKTKKLLGWKAPLSARDALIRAGQNYQNLKSN